MNRRCLNCGNTLTGRYCADCGQRASVRRFSVRTLGDAEFWEQNFSFTRGLPRTLFHLLYRPGLLAMDYLAGKRRQYFPFLGLVLLLIATDVLLRSYLDLSASEMMDARFGIGLRGINDESLGKVLLTYFRFVQLLIIPVVAYLLWLIFRTRTGYNFWEFVVLTTLLVSAQIWAALPTVVVANVLPTAAAQEVALRVGKVLSYAVTGLFIYQLAARHYPSGWSRIWRILLGLLVVYLTTKLLLIFGMFLIRYLETGNWDIIEGDNFMIDM